MVLQILPEPKLDQAPAYVPASVKSAFEQGERALKRGDYDASGVMFRKALDIATKTLNPAAKGNLKQRIDGLPAGSGVTTAMKEWAHAIRDDGNDAAHEEEAFTKDQAIALLQFTDTFLTYTFTLPEMVRQRRENSLT